MMRMVTLSSGSSGNCIYIGSQNHHILIDAGIAGKRVEEGLKQLELSPADLDAVFITHEHIDHIGGLGVLSRKYGLPIYATEGTLEQIQSVSSLGKMPEGLYHSIHAGESVLVGDLELKPFAVAHDAAEPVAYRVECGPNSVAVVTDLGEYTSQTVEQLQKLDALILEANHDVRMLQVGPYPYALKQRILGRCGHLSNEAAGHLLHDIMHDHLQKVVLGHLSKENNYADLAYETVRMEVTLGEGGWQGSELDLSVAPRTGLSQILEVG